ISTPWLHWPDTMVTYLKEYNLLFTGDIGGGYSIPTDIDDSDEKTLKEYSPFATKYVVTVIGHFREYITKNFDKLKQLGIINETKAVFPAHGLVFRKNPQNIFKLYTDVAEGNPEKGKILVIYDSMYGYVESAIKIAIDELTKNNCKVLIYKFTDTEYCDISDLLKDIPNSEALIIGASTYESSIHPYMRFVISTIIDKADYNKPVLAIGIHGWGGAVGKTLTQLMQSSKYRLLETLEFKGKLTQEVENIIRDKTRALLNT
ncbi:MAG: flavodoxin domain-containing protein, partial [Brevinematia bacterium]